MIRQINFTRAYAVHGKLGDEYFDALPEHDLSALFTFLHRHGDRLAIACAADVGANIGLASLCIHDLYPAANILAFEPTPELLVHLQRTLAANGVEAAVAVHPYALGARSGRSWFAASQDFSAANHLSDGIGDFEVEVRTLDEVLGDTPCDFLKIDVEGYEIAVLEGARRTLRRDRPPVLLECNPWALRVADEPLEGFLAKLIDLVGPVGRVVPHTGQLVALPHEAAAAEQALRAAMTSDRTVFDLVNLQPRFELAEA